MKKFLSYMFVWQAWYLSASANGLSKEEMYPTSKTLGVTGEGYDPLNQVLTYAKEFFFTVLGIVVISTFIYFGYKIIISKGNEDEFKKALLGFVYVIVGMAVIPLAWGAVKIISTLTF